MRELRALIWKEWHETRLFLWIAWGLFIGLPIIGGFEEMATLNHRHEFWASPWVLVCGPLLAIVVGVAATCRDLQPRLEDFWQSRPMGRVRLFNIKYCVGLLIVILACAVPLLVQLATPQTGSEALDTLRFVFLWIAIFSTAFAAGCFFHKPAYAAAVAGLATLLILVVPVVFPPLSILNTGRLIDTDRAYSYLGNRGNGLEHFWIGPLPAFACGMLLIAIVMTSLGLLAVRNGWRIQSEKPLIFGAGSTAFLVLLMSASYQLGTSLPILSTAEFATDPSTQVSWRDGVLMNGTTGRFWFDRWVTDSTRREGGYWRPYWKQLSVSDGHLMLGPESSVATDSPGFQSQDTLWVAHNPRDVSTIYRLDTDEPEGTVLVEKLEVYSVSSGGEALQGSPIELWRGPDASTRSGFLHLWNNRLYIIGERTMVFDVSTPLQPKLISDGPTINWRWSFEVSDEPSPTIFLPRVPGLPTIERLKFALSIYGELSATPDGTIWCRNLYNGTGKDMRFQALEEVHLKSLTDDKAVYEEVAQYKPTLLQVFSGGVQQGFIALQVKNDLLYAMQYGIAEVFCIKGPRPLSLVARFAAPNLHMCEPLDDGRIIAAGGNKIWLLGPPPRS